MHLCIYAVVYLCICAYTQLCMFACVLAGMCARMYVCMYACVHLFVCALFHVCMCARRQAGVHMCMCAWIYVCTYACVHGYICVHLCMYLWMHVCMYACVNVCLCAFVHVCRCLCMHVFMQERSSTFPLRLSRVVHSTSLILWLCSHFSLTYFLPTYISNSLVDFDSRYTCRRTRLRLHFWLQYLIASRTNTKQVFCGTWWLDVTAVYGVNLLLSLWQTSWRVYWMDGYMAG